jgi:ABC-2 type transport system permease protein
MSHLRREFLKSLFQKRTYIGWGGLFIIPFLITVAVRFSHAGGGGGPGADPMEQIMQHLRGNGVYVPIVALAVLSAFLLPLLASMVGSYTIAGEAENNTLRTVLMQPVRRGALLMAKWFVANVYVAIGLVIMGIAALIAGGAIFGLHPMQLLSGGATVSIGHAFGLTVLSYLYILAGMAAVVSLAVLFSTLTNSSLTAVGAALVLVIIMLALGGFSVFDFLKPYLITSHFAAWQNLFQRPIDYWPIWKGLINFAVWTGGTTGLAYLKFRRKDILS